MPFDKVHRFLNEFVEWAEMQPDIQAVALVGSHARNAATESSDVDLVVSRFRVSANPDVADPASEVILQFEKQSFNVHKGGGMEFDPRDNMLYVGMGDDRLLLIAQEDGRPKGKIFRLDVDKVARDATGTTRRPAAPPREIWGWTPSDSS